MTLDEEPAREPGAQLERIDSAQRRPRSFAFGRFTLVPERQLLLRGDAPLRIGGRALDLLTALVERPGEVVSKRELMARVWAGVVVDEGSLKVNMAALRRALGDDPAAAQYIATVTGRGYRFVASVQVSGSRATGVEDAPGVRLGDPALPKGAQASL
jgi:DNA-binding winged helix-turn-helix (wHTH) protein